MKMESIVKLFRAVPIKNMGKHKNCSKDLLSKTIKNDFIFSPEVIANYSTKELETLIKIVEKEIGLTAEQMNNSFHKSWEKIKNASDKQLFIEQIIHYMTTYGFESIGIYNSDTVYIPTEKLKIPSIKEDKIILVVIKGYTKKEIKTKLLELLQSGIALKEETINDVIEIANFVGIEGSEIESVKNKEVKVILYDKFDKFPIDPIEFLRFLIYKSTGKTLIIKNKEVIEEIKNKKFDASNLLHKYAQFGGLQRLAQIFYRFKPLFLAFRSDPAVKKYVNKIRKLAVKHHKPMASDYLNNVTAEINSGDIMFDYDYLETKLQGANIFRKIRLAYALKFRTKKCNSISYRIRNGKSYATDFEFDKQKLAKKALKIVIESIAKDIKVSGKKIYIPKNFVYALPTTEKQFIGNFPAGSYVELGTNIVLGVHWQNLEDARVDLDLSLLKIGKKMGWDADYTLFSGDMTDAPAPHGASELFYMSKSNPQDCLMMLNYFNQHDATKTVPFQIVIAKEQVKDFDRNYMINPNNVICVVNSEINKKQKMLGLLQITDNHSRFYFCESSIGNSITSRNSKMTDHGREWMLNYYTETISLKEVFEESGAIFVTNKEKADIDLSPEKLDRNTLINLITNHSK
jgi:hypothetical protein